MNLWGVDTEAIFTLVIAAAVGVVTFVALQLIRWLMGRAAGRVALGAEPTSMRVLPLRVLRETRLPILLLAAAYAGGLGLELAPRIANYMRIAGVLVLLAQCAVWGGELIGFWAERYQAQAAANGVTGGPATAFALRFMGSLALWTVLVLLALENAGVEITTLIAGLGIGGIALALAAQSVLGDFFASLAIVLDRPFVVGDFIAVDELRGIVESVGVKTTRVRSIDGEQLVFPNSDLVRSRIRNFGRLHERRVVARFRLAAGTTAATVEEATRILRAAIDAEPAVGLDRVHFTGITAGSPDLEAVYYVQSSDFGAHMAAQESIQLAALRGFGDAGIGLAGGGSPGVAGAGAEPGERPRPDGPYLEEPRPD